MPKLQAFKPRLTIAAALLVVSASACSDQVACTPTGEVGYIREAVSLRPYVVQWVKARRHQCTDGTTPWLPEGP